MLKAYDIKFYEKTASLNVSVSLDELQHGQIFWLGLNKDTLSLSWICVERDPGHITVIPVSVCYDAINDIFMTHQNKVPKKILNISKNPDVCGCYREEGYSECDCISKTINFKIMIKWFQENHTNKLKSETYSINDSINDFIENYSVYFGTANRDTCKTLFTPSHDNIHFPELLNYYTKP